MAGLMDLYAAQAGVNEQPLQTLPRSLGERIEATAAETFSPDRYFNIAGARREAWQRSVDELHSTTGETFANPYGPVTSEEMMRLGNQPAITTERSRKIIEAARIAKAQGNEDLFDPENIDRYIGEEATRRREKAASYEGTGNGILNFIAGAGMATVEPLNVLTLGVPVSRLPTAAANAIGRSFLGNVGREAALQAGVNVAAQGATELLDYTSRSETGTEQTLGEIATNLAGAAVFGGLIGGGARALHLKWLGLPEEVRAKAPLEVKDAFRVIEADSIYSGQNRLGVDPMLHERYQGRAMDAVMRGKPVDLADLTRTADSPMTALGTILREAPEDIRARGLDIMERIEAMPGAMTDLAREAKPDLFTAANSRGSDDLVKEELANLYDKAGAVPRRRKDMRDQAAFNVFARETSGSLERRLGDVELSREEAGDLFRHYKRRAGETPDQALDRAIDAWGDATERSALSSPWLDEQWAKDVEELGLSILNDTRVGALSYTDFRGNETHFPAATNWGTMGPRPEEDIPFGQVRATAEAGGRNGPSGRPESGTRGPVAEGREGAAAGGPQEAVRRDLLAAVERGQASPDLLAAIQRADLMRQARLVRETMPDGPPPKFEVAPEGTKAAPDKPDPEAQAALDTEAQRILETPGALGNLKRTATRELEAADLDLKDARAAMGCVMNGGGIP